MVSGLDGFTTRLTPNRPVILEFRDFVYHADDALLDLFQSIDRDHNGELDRNELKEAFSKAGITVSNSTLDEFLEQMDQNNDGVISYSEWRYACAPPFSMNTQCRPISYCRTLLTNRSRDFLLFLPTDTASLRTVLSYYKATGNLNPEGDVDINETLQGLGTEIPTLYHFLHSLANILYHLCQASISRLSAAPFNLVAVAYAETSSAEPASDPELLVLDADLELEWLPVPQTVAMWMSVHSFELKLTDLFPHLGYFIAGGVAGAVSRTATAPLDRLKVYLIAQTGVREEAVRAAKKGAPLSAIGRGLKSLTDATKELWRAGGIRSLFAGW
jgi:solute carrier family 25 phosphate transporter 23/24/25/41